MHDLDSLIFSAVSVETLGSQRVYEVPSSWSLSAKERNRLQHALCGNSDALSELRAIRAAMTDAAIDEETDFWSSVLPSHVCVSLGASSSNVAERRSVRLRHSMPELLLMLVPDKCTTRIVV